MSVCVGDGYLRLRGFHKQLGAFQSTVADDSLRPERIVFFAENELDLSGGNGAANSYALEFCPLGREVVAHREQPYRPDRVRFLNRGLQVLDRRRLQELPTLACRVADVEDHIGDRREIKLFDIRGKGQLPDTPRGTCA